MLKENPEVLKAKEDRAKLLGYIVTAENMDEKRDDAPRPISPVKPMITAELPFVRLRSDIETRRRKDLLCAAYTVADKSRLVRCLDAQLQEQLLDAQDKIGELEEINERHKDEIAALKAELAARPTVDTTSSASHATSALEALRARNEELEKVFAALESPHSPSHLLNPHPIMYPGNVSSLPPSYSNAESSGPSWRTRIR